jgi:hypothetical protein
VRKTEDICQNAGSTRALENIRNRLKLCQKSHPGCRLQVAPSGLPTRVLDIGNATEDGQILPVIVQLKGVEAPYVALSHCWGNQDKAVMPRTTSLNLDTQENGISMESLPPTFRDAINLTRRLNMRYLWIDSLCILQDDTADWEKESLQMASIYQNARLVISAAAASNCNGGLFVSRPSWPSYKVHTTKDSYSTVYVRPTLDHGDFTSAKGASRISGNPLFNRAWAFQERLSARRAIHFCANELVWECNSIVWCECGDLQEVGPLESLKLGQTDLLKLRSTIHRNPDEVASHLARTMNHWNETIRQFTRRQLTYDYDRLPALSSLAEQISTHSLGIYFAGIWSYSLVEKDGLCWRRVQTHDSPPGASLRQISRYCAPSWSWASVRGEIEPDGIASLWPTARNRRIENLLCEKAEIHCIDCTPANFDVPFSSVAFGHITIRGLRTLGNTDSWIDGGIPPKSPVEGCNLVFYPDDMLGVKGFHSDEPPICLWLKSSISIIEATGDSELVDSDVIIDVALVLERTFTFRWTVPGTYERRGLLMACTRIEDLENNNSALEERKSFISGKRGIFTIV